MDENFMASAYQRIRQAVAAPSPGSSSSSSPADPAAVPTLPSAERLAAARASLPRPGDAGYLMGRGPEATLDHLLGDVAPALTGQNRSGRYWGFVTGSTLPVAEVADNLVSAWDPNVQVHLPGQTIATEVEDAALRMLLALLGLDPASWEGRTFTTGATASNVLGLACGRERVISQRLPPSHSLGADVRSSLGELGLLRACALAGVDEFRVLTSMAHSSVFKASSIVGLGREAVKELPHSEAEPWRLDLRAVEEELERSERGQRRTAFIIAVSLGEVNTGRFATTGRGDFARLRALADRYGAWIHVDGAFGIFARALPSTPEFADLHTAAAGLEFADSITVDGHKLLNVPYDNGMFFTRSSATLTSVFQNPNAAYLSSPSSSSSASSSGGSIPIQSPLNIGIENSRRFRALPAYAVLLSEGREGLAEMLARMVRLARGIARFIAEEASGDYVLLPEEEEEEGEGKKNDVSDRRDDGKGRQREREKTHIVVLFRARDDGLNEVLVDAINRTAEWYVSGTKWQGRTACRVAVASWRVDVEADLALVKRSLGEIARRYKSGDL
ncbi:pyridoxal-dependent decarboxylase [Xylariomycetidae sp. FL2044]|nr:pyridoxal-dependent decarboxylase [Xylariomycetidae sp. FL2044]